MHDLAFENQINSLAVNCKYCGWEGTIGDYRSKHYLSSLTSINYYNDEEDMRQRIAMPMSSEYNEN